VMSFVGRLGLGRVNAYCSRLIGSRSPHRCSSTNSFQSTPIFPHLTTNRRSLIRHSRPGHANKRLKSPQMLLSTAFTIAFRVSGGLGIMIVHNASRNPQWLFIH